MRAERRLRRLEKSYQQRALGTMSQEEISFLLAFCRRAYRDGGFDSIAAEHRARAFPLLTLLNGEWS
jgi:hypothetical protein